MADKKKPTNAEEPQAAYKRGGIKIYSSFEDQETQQRQYYLSLTGEERLALMRKYINIAYGMYGYTFNKKPSKRTIRIE